jgi:hypothetical protein
MPGTITTAADSAVTAMFPLRQRASTWRGKVTGGGLAGQVQVGNMDAIMPDMAKLPRT